MKSKCFLLKKKIKIMLADSYMRYYSIFHKINDTILFESFCGGQYSDNPRAVSEKMHDMYPDHRILWLMPSEYYEKNKMIIPDYVECVDKGMPYYQARATAFCYVTNEGIQHKFKRKGQFFIQTWHGDRQFKKVLYQSKDHLEIPVTDKFVTDLCLSGSDCGTNLYQEGFRYKGEILKYGMPRNDRLILNNYDDIAHIRKILGLQPGKKVLLYAPTFRDYKKKSKMWTGVDLKAVLIKLNKKRRGDWVCLVRGHPRHSGLDIICDGSRIIDVTSYPDMTDLLLVSDMLITDYSSSAGDYVLLKRPVILAAFDRDNYEKNCREFKVPIDKPGFLIAENQNELEKLIMSMTEEDYKSSCDKVMKYYGIVESGNSAGMICERIQKFYLDTFKALCTENN